MNIAAISASDFPAPAFKASEYTKLMQATDDIAKMADGIHK
jgi:hypothetical protein